MPDFALREGVTLRGGSYRILRFISAGGFGCTYEAIHTGLNHRVAIKEFFVKTFCNRDPQTSRVSVGSDNMSELDGKLKGKFMEEARAVFALSHPGIVRVADVFEENGTAYFVMDYIEGESLEQLVDRKGRLPEAEALGYIRQAADALAYVHSTKRLHLDIKPANIMIDGNGRAILIDFGVSKQYDEAGSENTSTLLGRTPGYAPIEQLGPKLRDFTPATDIYALAATLYKAVTGNTPPDAIDLHITEELSFPADVSAATRSAIEAAMRQKAGDRPQTIADFLALLASDAQPAKPEAKPATASDAASPASAKSDNKGSKTEVAIPSQQERPAKKKALAVVLISPAVISIILIVILIVWALWWFLPKAHIQKEGEQNDSITTAETVRTFTFTEGNFKYKVIAKGKVEVAQSDFREISGHLNIPSTITYGSTTYEVTSIAYKAFDNCSSLSSVTIPNSVTSIGHYAFWSCGELTSVKILNPNCVIGKNAFEATPYGKKAQPSEF